MSTAKKNEPEPLEKQLVSKKRVADHGEVYTRKREVNAMLDLVKNETERIDSKFLEPACGTGNFLMEVLDRKLRVVGARYGRILYEYETNAVIAVASIYGIDILEDNVVECRRRLLTLFEQHYPSLFRDECIRTVNYILGRNIVWGDALTLKTAGENPRPIVFSEWTPVRGGMFQRTDFAFSELLSCAGMLEEPLFSDLGEKAFLPTPVRKFPVTHYLRLADAET
jgi:hypothetical protein